MRPCNILAASSHSRLARGRGPVHRTFSHNKKPTSGGFQEHPRSSYYPENPPADTAGPGFAACRMESLTRLLVWERTPWEAVRRSLHTRANCALFSPRRRATRRKPDEQSSCISRASALAKTISPISNKPSVKRSLMRSNTVSAKARTSRSVAMVEDGNLRIEIEDDGPGFEPQNMSEPRSRARFRHHGHADAGRSRYLLEARTAIRLEKRLDEIAASAKRSCS